MITVNALRLAFEVHLASQAQWLRVNVICKCLVDGVLLERLVDEEIVFHFLLQVHDKSVQALNLVVFDANVLKELNACALGFLTLFFNFEQVV